MAQRPTSDFNIDPNITSGTDLANILNRFQDAIDSGNSGTSRPAYLAAGGLWVKTGTPMRLYFYDGTKDNELYNTADGIVDKLEDGTVDGQITTWNASSGKWTPDSAVVVDANGNVGIGEQNPSREIHITNKDSGAVPAIRIESEESNLWMRSAGSAGAFPGGNGEGGTQIFSTNSKNFHIGINSNAYGSECNLIFMNGRNYDERMRIDNAGRVGIGGYGSEGALLDVHRDHIATHPDPVVRFVGNHGGQAYQNLSGLQYYWNTSNGSAESELVYGNSANSYFRFIHNNGGTFTERMRIDASGRVGIGGTPSRSTKEIEDEAESTLANWKSQLDERLRAEPKADKKAVTQEITGHDKMPTKAELVERLTERDIGGGNAKLQVSGDGYFSGTVNADQFVDANGPIVGAFTMVEAFRKIKNAVADETTVEGIKESLTNALGGLIEEFESIGTQES